MKPALATALAVVALERAEVAQGAKEHAREATERAGAAAQCAGTAAAEAARASGAAEAAAAEARKVGAIADTVQQAGDHVDKAASDARRAREDADRAAADASAARDDTGRAAAAARRATETAAEVAGKSEIERKAAEKALTQAAADARKAAGAAEQARGAASSAAGAAQDAARRADGAVELARAAQLAAENAEGQPGPMGPMPRHEWDDTRTRVRFETAPGKWGEWSAVLKGADGVVFTQRQFVPFGGNGGGGLSRDEVLQLIEGSMATDLTEPEFLDDQTSAGSVLTFAFSEPVRKAWVELKATSLTDTSEARVRTDGGTPDSDTGAIIHAGSPMPFSGTIETVKVLADSGKVVAVYGYR